MIWPNGIRSNNPSPFDPLKELHPDIWPDTGHFGKQEKND